MVHPVPDTQQSDNQAADEMIIDQVEQQHVPEDLSFMLPFVPTGISVSILRQAKLPGTEDVVYFIEQFLLLGDGLIFLIIRTIIMQRAFGGNAWTGGRFYRDSMTAQEFRDSIAGINQLPANIVASVMGTETFQPHADMEVLASEFRQIQRFLYNVGVRFFVMLPQPLSRISDEVRLDYHDVLAAGSDEEWTYQFFLEILETVRSRPQRMDRFFRFVHQDCKRFATRLAEFVLDLEPVRRPNLE